MPQAVQKYIDTHSFEDTDRVKRQILTLYRNSIYDYAGNYAEKVVSIFDQIPSQLQKHEKKFKLADLSKDARMRDYDSAFLWLKEVRKEMLNNWKMRNKSTDFILFIHRIE